jgi:hypothetical protein
VPGFRTSLDKHNFKLLGFLLTLLCSDLALIVQICLITDKDDDNVITAFTTNIIDPFRGIDERGTVCGESAFRIRGDWGRQYS